MWLLQTDPDYFYEVATYWNQHNLNTISGAKANKDVKIHALGAGLVIYSITQVEDWESLEDELRNVRVEFEANREAIRYGQHLPKTYDQALGCLENLVLEVLFHKATHLKELCYVLPAWKPMWRVQQKLDNAQYVLDYAPDWFNYVDPICLRLWALGAIGEQPQ